MRSVAHHLNHRFKANAVFFTVITYVCLTSAHAQDEYSNTAQHAHVHGVVNVDVAIDGNSLLINLTSPQADITGFERSPRDEVERKKVLDARATLQSNNLFQPAAQAKCKMHTAEVSHLSDQIKISETPDHSHEHDHDHQHSDVEVSYQFNCEAAEDLDFIDLGLMKAFPSINTINAQIASPKGQYMRQLNGTDTRLTWK